MYVFLNKLENGKHENHVLFQLAPSVNQLKPYVGEKAKNFRDLFLLTISG